MCRIIETMKDSENLVRNWRIKTAQNIKVKNVSRIAKVIESEAQKLSAGWIKC